MVNVLLYMLVIFFFYFFLLLVCHLLQEGGLEVTLGWRSGLLLLDLLDEKAASRSVIQRRDDLSRPRTSRSSAISMGHMTISSERGVSQRSNRRALTPSVIAAATSTLGSTTTLNGQRFHGGPGCAPRGRAAALPRH